MATTHFPFRRALWAQALPFVVAGSALSSVVAWSGGRNIVASAALLPGVAAVLVGVRPRRSREALDDSGPPRFHPARHDLGSGLLQRLAFEDRMRRADGWAAVAMCIADPGSDHRWITDVIAVTPVGGELGLLGDGRLGVLLDANAGVAETIAAMRRAAGPTVRIGLSIGGYHDDVVEALRAAERQCRMGAFGVSGAFGVRGAFGARGAADVRGLARPTPARALSLEADLRAAIDGGALEVRFQPVIDLTRGTVLSMEALARWTHVEDGPISPDVFIPIAERSGSIDSLTDLVLGRSLDACAAWHSAGSPVRVAVNISAITLRSRSFPNKVAAALSRRAVDARWLTLEITEGNAVPDEPITNAVLADLRAMGVRLAMDDFGTGYSSFEQLLRLAVDEVKIDRSFVARCLDSVTEAAVVRSVIELGQRLGIDVVAEGVEDTEVRDHLAGLGCGSMQGYLASYPLPADEAAAWLVAHQPSSR